MKTILFILILLFSISAGPSAEPEGFSSKLNIRPSVSVAITGQLYDRKMGEIPIVKKIEKESDLKSIFSVLRSLRIKELSESKAREYLDPGSQFATLVSLVILCEYPNHTLKIRLIGERILILNGRVYESVENVNERLVEYFKSIGAIKDDPKRHIAPQ